MAMESDEMRDFTGLYVLGALSPVERAAFEAHVATCTDCAAEVLHLSKVAGVLGQMAPQVEPPRALRDRVMAVAGTRGPRLATMGPVRAPAPPRPPEPELSIAPPSLDVQPKGRRSVGPLLAAAAALIAAVGLGVYATQVRDRADATENRLREASVRLEDNAKQAADVRRTLVGAQSELAVLTAPDVVRVELAGQAAAPTASARAFWSSSQGLLFTAANLPPLPAGQIYQIWYVGAPAPTSAGLVRPDAAGRVRELFVSPPSMNRPTAMAVTIEPAGGVNAPTGAMYVVGRL